MALSMASPCGVLSNEEDGMAVFESTAADVGGRLNGVTLPELSIISPGLEHRPSIREVRGLNAEVITLRSKDIQGSFITGLPVHQ